MANTDSGSWLDANKAATEALALAKSAAAVQKAQSHLMMLVLATLAKTAPKETVEQLLQELERVRDLSGPAGAAAGEVFATAYTTLERFAARRD